MVTVNTLSKFLLKISIYILHQVLLFCESVVSQTLPNVLCKLSTGSPSAHKPQTFNGLKRQAREHHVQSLF